MFWVVPLSSARTALAKLKSEITLEREEVLEFRIDVVAERSRPAIEVVMKFRRGEGLRKGETIGVDQIWHTDPGKRFGQQVGQLLEFVNKGHVLTVLPSLTPFVQGMFREMQNRSFSRSIESSEKKPPPQDVRLVTEIEDLAGRVDGMDLKAGLDALPSAEDRPWYSSLVIFAVYTYLDTYSQSLVDLIRSDSQLSSLLEAHLIEIADMRPDKSRSAAVRVEDMKRFSIERRLTTIENGLSFRPILLSVVGNDEMDALKRAFSSFVAIRNKAAHSNPRLDHEEYTFDELENDLNDLMVNANEVDAFVRKIGFAQYGLDSIKKETSQVASVLRKVQLILLMSAVYPALIDAVLHAAMSV